MKYLKMLGLAAIAAMGLMAFVGASTASATTLFTDEAKKVPYGVGTTIHATLVPGTSAALKSGSTTIATCTESTVHGVVTVATGSVVSGHLSTEKTKGSEEPTGLHWGGCSQTTHTISTGTLDIEYTSGTSGKVTGTGNSVTLGIFGTSCTYGTGAGVTLGTITGGTAPVLKINANIPRTAGGFLCPSTGTWEAEYVVTSPHALYVGA